MGPVMTSMRPGVGQFVMRSWYRGWWWIFAHYFFGVVEWWFFGDFAIFTGFLDGFFWSLCGGYVQRRGC
jgi:hypothetical protein